MVAPRQRAAPEVDQKWWDFDFEENGMCTSPSSQIQPVPREKSGVAFGLQGRFPLHITCDNARVDSHCTTSSQINILSERIRHFVFADCILVENQSNNPVPRSKRLLENRSLAVWQSGRAA